jgi:hypothetical protein
VPALPELDIARDNLAFRLMEVLDLLRGQRRVEVRAAAVTTAATMLRQVGICDLLEAADAGRFQAHLQLGAQAYAELLASVRWDDVVDRFYLCASRAEPFFDAVAAGDLALGLAIAGAAPTEWSEEDEYQDDFAFVRAAMALLGDGRTEAPDAGAWVDRLVATAPDGPDDPRALACGAILRRAAGDLREAMTALARAHASRVEKDRAEPTTSPEWLATEAHVDVVSLALGRLGALRGLALPARLRFVPSAVLRRPGPAPLPPGAWLQGALDPP